MKQRKFSFKHGKVAADIWDNYCDDDDDNDDNNDDDNETMVVTMTMTMINGREWWGWEILIKNIARSRSQMGEESKEGVNPLLFHISKTLSLNAWNN